MDSELRIERISAEDLRFIQASGQADPIPTQHLHTCAIAIQNDAIVGRVAVYINTYFDTDLGLIGGWWCVEDDVVAGALLHWAEDELMKLGKARVIGPMNGSTWQNYRFCTDRNQPAFFSDVDNPLYYSKQWEKHGYQALYGYYSQESSPLTWTDSFMNEFESEHFSNGYRLAEIDLNQAEAQLRQIGEFCIEAFQYNLMYSPITADEFVAMYLPMVPYMKKELITMVVDSKGVIHGINFCLHNHLNPDGGEYIVKTLAKKPDTPLKGIGYYLIDSTQKRAHELGYTTALHALMQMENRSTRISDHHNGTPRSYYHLFEKHLTKP